MNIETDKKIKGLKSQLQKLKGDISSHKEDIKTQQKLLAQKQRRAEEIVQAIKNIQNKSDTLRVTEHALLRYFERVCGYDIEDIKKKIVNAKILKDVTTLGNGKFPNGEFMVVVQNGSIVTIE